MTAARPALWGPILVAALAALVVANLGGLLTDIGPWYQNLQRPSWQPPDWLFPPAWTLIFALSATSGVLAWRAAPDAANRRRIVGAFAVNAVLNVLWSALFFSLRRPDWALIEVALLWLSIVLLIVVTGRVSRAAAWLLLPYLVWVSFASALNYAVVHLNGPFGGS
ncbi:MAG: tryptophan-rich sensory protein [Rhodospirillales bacterium]|nr:tryptophan-rich sensory protein [Rhodospirillales bacterium]